MFLWKTSSISYVAHFSKNDSRNTVRCSLECEKLLYVDEESADGITDNQEFVHNYVQLCIDATCQLLIGWMHLALSSHPHVIISLKMYLP